MQPEQNHSGDTRQEEHGAIVHHAGYPRRPGCRTGASGRRQRRMRAKVVAVRHSFVERPEQQAAALAPLQPMYCRTRFQASPRQEIAHGKR
eukprot:scaffold8550_cov267-Pinguiococcus_pyrenoidosus.AAC.1